MPSLYQRWCRCENKDCSSGQGQLLGLLWPDPIGHRSQLVYPSVGLRSTNCESGRFTGNSSFLDRLRQGLRQSPLYSSAYCSLFHLSSHLQQLQFSQISTNFPIRMQCVSFQQPLQFDFFHLLCRRLFNVFRRSALFHHVHLHLNSSRLFLAFSDQKSLRRPLADRTPVLEAFSSVANVCSGSPLTSLSGRLMTTRCGIWVIPILFVSDRQILKRIFITFWTMKQSIQGESKPFRHSATEGIGEHLFSEHQCNP